MNSEKPYISIVATSRNDDHGGDMRKRMTIFVKGLINQCNRFKLPCELVLVDWNSENSNELLHTILPRPVHKDFLSIKYVIVPPEIHNSMRYSEQFGLYQMIAKNVGIRRSKAPFVLCSNVDLLFSDELFEKLSRRDLKRGFYYRANRCDIPKDIDENWPIERQLEYCKRNTLNRLGKNRRFSAIKDTSSFIFRHKQTYPIIDIFNNIKRKLNSEKSKMIEIDTDACGDFTLMSKEDWNKIQGYVELQMYSLHIDSMALFAAKAAGIEQVIFEPAECTFHIQHDNGWELDDPIKRLEFYSQKPSLDWFFVYTSGRKIIEEKGNYGINEENWGLADRKLEEILING